jgi:hypothetical protein
LPDKGGNGRMVISMKSLIWLIVVLILSICGCEAFNNQPQAYRPPVYTPPKFDLNKDRYKTFSKETLNQILKNPQKYRGKLYALEGDVIQASESENTITFQIRVADPFKDFDLGETLIVSYPSSETSVVKEHTVMVMGYIGSDITGKNIFGGTISTVIMEAIAIFDYKTQTTYSLVKHKGTVDKWISGELFK